MANFLRHRAGWSPNPRHTPIGSIELDQSHPLAAGLLGFYPLINDARSLTGTNNGTPTSSLTWSVGQVGPMLKPNPGYVNLGSTIAPTTAVTYVAWIVPQGTGNLYQSLVDRSNGASDYIELFWLNSSQLAAYARGSAAVQLDPSSSGVSPNSLWCIALTADASNLKLWLNGVQAGSVGSPGTMSTATSNTYIGNSPAVANRNFQGIISGVRIYNRALSQDHLAWVYNEPWADVRPVPQRRVFVVVTDNGATGSGVLGAVVGSGTASQVNTATASVAIGAVAAPGAASQANVATGTAAVGAFATDASAGVGNVAAGQATLGAVVATASASQTVVAIGVGALGPVVALGLVRPPSLIVSTLTIGGQPLTIGSAPIEVLAAGVTCSAAVSFGAIAASGTATQASAASGTVSLGAVAASAAASQANAASGTVTLGTIAASGVAVAGSAAIGTATLGPISATGSASQVNNASSSAILQALQVSGAASSGITAAGTILLGSLRVSATAGREVVATASPGLGFAALVAASQINVAVGETVVPALRASIAAIGIAPTVPANRRIVATSLRRIIEPGSQNA
jgi:hypothetical protein